jgi:O-antigen/teichoic acid export membrane protein
MLPEPSWLKLLPSSLSKRLRGRHVLHAVIANSGWLLTERVVRIALAVLVGAWVARYLGPSRYGELAYVIALLTLFQAAAGLGLDNIVIRDLSQRPMDAPSILGTALALRLGAGVACWFALVAVTASLRHGDSVGIAMATLLGAGLVLQSSDVIDLWFQSRSRSKLTTTAKIIAYLASSLVKVALIVSQAPVLAFAAALLCDVALATLALTWTYFREPMRSGWHWSRGIALGMLKESWPLMMAGLSVVIYMRIDQLILRAMTNEHELGLYSAILPFSQAWHVVPMTVCASVLPRLSALKLQDSALYQQRLQQLFSLMAWSGAAVAAVTALLAPWLISLLLGPAYAEAVPVLRWHALSNVFVFLGVAQSVAIASDRTPNLSLAKTLCGAAASVALNVSLIPYWGAVGASWAAIGAYFCAAVLTNLFLAPASLSMQIKAFWPFYVQRS